jgi:hypothetical protein
VRMCSSGISLVLGKFHHIYADVLGIPVGPKSAAKFATANLLELGEALRGPLNSRRDRRVRGNSCVPPARVWQPGVQGDECVQMNSSGARQGRGLNGYSKIGPIAR